MDPIGSWAAYTSPYTQLSNSPGSYQVGTPSRHETLGSPLHISPVKTNFDTVGKSSVPPTNSQLLLQAVHNSANLPSREMMGQTSVTGSFTSCNLLAQASVAYDPVFSSGFHHTSAKSANYNPYVSSPSPKRPVQQSPNSNQNTLESDLSVVKASSNSSHRHSTSYFEQKPVGSPHSPWSHQVNDQVPSPFGVLPHEVVGNGIEKSKTVNETSYSVQFPSSSSSNNSNSQSTTLSEFSKPRNYNKVQPRKPNLSASPERLRFTPTSSASTSTQFYHHNTLKSYNNSEGTALQDVPSHIGTHYQIDKHLQQIPTGSINTEKVLSAPSQLPVSYYQSHLSINTSENMKESITQSLPQPSEHSSGFINASSSHIPFVSESNSVRDNRFLPVSKPELYIESETYSKAYSEFNHPGHIMQSHLSEQAIHSPTRNYVIQDSARQAVNFSVSESHSKNLGPARLPVVEEQNKYDHIVGVLQPQSYLVQRHQQSNDSSLHPQQYTNVSCKSVYRQNNNSQISTNETNLHSESILSVSNEPSKVSRVEYSTNPQTHSPVSTHSLPSPLDYTANPIGHAQSPLAHAASPLANVQSPVTHSQSPLAHIQSPIAHTQSPFNHPQSPLHHAPSPLHHAPSPLHHAPSPLHHALSPLHHAPSPVHHAPSPVHHALSPLGHTQSPVAHALQSPIGHTQQSPIGHTQAPSLHTQAPFNHAESPLSHAQSPLDLAQSPVGQAHSPLCQAHISTDHTFILSGNSASPLGHNASPLGHNASPLGHNASPLGHNASPLGHNASPLGHTTSPPGQIQNSVNHVSSPVVSSHISYHNAQSPVYTSYQVGISDSDSYLKPQLPDMSLKQYHEFDLRRMTESQHANVEVQGSQSARRGSDIIKETCTSAISQSKIPWKGCSKDHFRIQNSSYDKGIKKNNNYEYESVRPQDIDMPASVISHSMYYAHEDESNDIKSCDIDLATITQSSVSGADKKIFLSEMSRISEQQTDHIKCNSSSSVQLNEPTSAGYPEGYVKDSIPQYLERTAGIFSSISIEGDGAQNNLGTSAYLTNEKSVSNLVQSSKQSDQSFSVGDYTENLKSHISEPDTENEVTSKQIPSDSEDQRSADDSTSGILPVYPTVPFLADADLPQTNLSTCSQVVTEDNSGYVEMNHEKTQKVVFLDVRDELQTLLEENLTASDLSLEVDFNVSKQNGFLDEYIKFFHEERGISILRINNSIANNCNLVHDIQKSSSKYEGFQESFTSYVNSNLSSSVCFKDKEMGVDRICKGNNSLQTSADREYTLPTRTTSPLVHTTRQLNEKKEENLKTEKRSAKDSKIKALKKSKGFLRQNSNGIPENSAPLCASTSNNTQVLDSHCNNEAEQRRRTRSSKEYITAKQKNKQKRDGEPVVRAARREMTHRKAKEISNAKRYKTTRYGSREDSDSVDEDSACRSADKDSSDDDAGNRKRSRRARLSTTNKRARLSLDESSSVDGSNVNKLRRNRTSKGRLRGQSISSLTEKSPWPSDARINTRRGSIVDSDLQSGDFVIMKSDVGLPHPSLWRIDGRTLLQKYESFEESGKILYRNISTYTNWTPENRHLYQKVPVRFVVENPYETIVALEKSHTGSRYRVLFEQSVNDSAKLFGNFEVYIQTLISQALDSNFLTEVYQENDEYFLSNMRSIDEAADNKMRQLLNAANWPSNLQTSVETWPCFYVSDKPIDDDGKGAMPCYACRENSATLKVQMYGQPYNRTTLEGCQPDPMLVSQKDFLLCKMCMVNVDLYNKISHQKYQMYVHCAKRVADERSDNQDKNSMVILNELLGDEVWLRELFLTLRSVWAEVDVLDFQG